MKRFSLFFASLSALLFGSAQTAHAADTVAVNFPPATEQEFSNAATEAIASPTHPPPPSADIALNFAPPTSPNPQPPPLSPLPSTPTSDSSQIFANGSNSLVARTVGHAEGTRTADGGKTSAYQGHVDPGNGVWNLGSFSFQHCQEAAYNCSTPEEADVYQLQRLQRQAAELQQRAAAVGLTMTLEEELNGIDLANQAPAAALGTPGYVEWLKRAREEGRLGQDAILRARVDSYWDPNLNGWNAPGLGNTEANITHDQNRRRLAIARALQAYQEQLTREQVASRLIEQDLQDS
jgi:hypothetical protein